MAHACTTSTGLAADHAPECCPLCGRPNDCQLCTAAAYKGPCWCATVAIPDELIAQVPAGLRNKACLCRHCVAEFHHAKEGKVAGRFRATGVRPKVAERMKGYGILLPTDMFDGVWEVR